MARVLMPLEIEAPDIGCAVFDLKADEFGDQGRSERPEHLTTSGDC